MTRSIVGVWTVEAREPGRPRVEQATHAYHPDGILSIAGATYTAHGTWTATSDTAVALQALLPTPAGEGFDGWLTMSGTLELAAEGTEFEAQAMVLRPTPSGTPIERPVALRGLRFGR